MVKATGMLAFAVAGVISVAAVAQPVGIGVTKGGAVEQMGAAVSSVVSAKSGVQMRTAPMAGAQQYAAAINAGQLEFGLVSSMEFAMNMEGTHASQGQKKPNLRIAATLVPFNTGLLVPEKSGIRKISDLKGKRVAWGFPSAPLIQWFTEGMLANGGLTGNDIEQVPSIALRQGFTLLQQGKVEAAGLAVGSAPVKELASSIDGGVRFVTLSPDPEAVARMHKFVPRTIATRVNPAPNLDGIPEPTYVLGYYYMLTTSTHVPAATVEKVLKVVMDSPAELKASSPLWRNFTVEVMPLDHGGLPYHDAAIAFYKKAGLWKR